MKSVPNSFFLLISPPSKVKEYVSTLKKQVKGLIGHSYESLHSIAHLSLLQYDDFHNESLLYTFKDRATRIKAFEISIDGFNTFRSNGTIYLDIINKYSIGSVAETLIDRSITPHITIAKNLNQKDFDTVWKLVKEFSYSYWFTCDRITVLKWFENKWMPHGEFILGK